MNRRDFLQSIGVSAATAAFLRSSLARAAALPAVHRSGTIEDVEHVVVFMQENRSFDHYFGHLPGVRGYSDRFPLQLPGGKPVWFQPRMQRPGETILPFHLDTRRSGAQLVEDLDHSWGTQHGAIAGGRFDGWPRCQDRYDDGLLPAVGCAVSLRPGRCVHDLRSLLLLHRRSHLSRTAPC